MENLLINYDNFRKKARLGKKARVRKTGNMKRFLAFYKKAHNLNKFRKLVLYELTKIPPSL